MEYRHRYYSWLTNKTIDVETKRELLSLPSNYEIEDRFYKNIDFGTAGIRGKMEAGANRVNKYTVGLVSQAYAGLLSDQGKETVVVSYDTRRGSKDFAQLAARIFASANLKVYLSDGVLSTPITSYVIRKIGADGGLIVTASHNPAEYNGLKIYGPNGGQILEDQAEKIRERLEELKFSDIKASDMDELRSAGKIDFISEDLYQSYISDALDHKINDVDTEDFRISYSPFNGTGLKPVEDIFKARSFSYSLVEDQKEADPDFPTIKKPNPEIPETFDLSIENGKKNKAHILLANDPDADRMGLMVLDKGEYKYLDGNQTGPLLLNYILEEGKKRGILPDKPFAVKTIVTGDLAKAIAKNNDCEIFETLTGFKNIALTMEEKIGEGLSPIFSFEESTGYLPGSSIRDKDGILSIMLTSEMAAFYKEEGKSLVDVLEGLYEKYGYYLNKNFFIKVTGLDREKKVDKIMDSFKENPIEDLGGYKLSKVIDYEKDDTGIPRSKVIKYFYGHNWFAVRPSGTEPKLKFYINVREDTREEAEKLVEVFKKAIEERVK